MYMYMQHTNIYTVPMYRMQFEAWLSISTRLPMLLVMWQIHDHGQVARDVQPRLKHVR